MTASSRTPGARIVLFGATGYTGQLIARELAAAGHRPLLVGRRESALTELARELGGLDWATADAGDPGQLRALLSAGDVLVSTVGPFALHGRPALEAAIAQGAHYIDSTGEPSFVRTVFDDYSLAAKDAGVTVLPAFGYDYVPGHLAAALAAERAGSAAARVDVGYFASGGLKFSGGTIQSAALAMLEDSYAWRDGKLQGERFGQSLMRHPVPGRRRPRRSISVAGSELLLLPASYPGLRQIRVGLGVAGPATPLQWAALRAAAPLLARPGVRRRLRSAATTRLPASTGGPSEAFNERARILITAHTYDEDGRPLSAVELRGPSIYTFTKRAISWAAVELAAAPPTSAGVVGPVEAFGLPALTQGCASIGLQEHRR